MTGSNLAAKTTEVVQVVTPQVLQRDNFFGRNKQKLLGLAIVTVGYLQLPANLDVIQGLVGEAFMPVTNMVLGLCALWFGFLNNPPVEGT
jgi:hypothetical protein